MINKDLSSYIPRNIKRNMEKVWRPKNFVVDCKNFTINKTVYLVRLDPHFFSRVTRKFWIPGLSRERPLANGSSDRTTDRKDARYKYLWRSPVGFRLACSGRQSTMSNNWRSECIKLFVRSYHEKTVCQNGGSLVKLYGPL